jgi:hypothetical protein
MEAFENISRLVQNVKPQLLSFVRRECQIGRIARALIREYLKIKLMQKLSTNSRAIRTTYSVISRSCGDSRHSRMEIENENADPIWEDFQDFGHRRLELLFMNSPGLPEPKPNSASK